MTRFTRASYASAGTSHDLVSASVSVRLSVSSRSSIETGERIELVFGVGSSFHPSYTVLKETSGISRIMLFPSITLSQTLDVENFASVRVIDLVQGVINWTVVDQLS